MLITVQQKFLSSFPVPSLLTQIPTPIPRYPLSFPTSNGTPTKHNYNPAMMTNMESDTSETTSPRFHAKNPTYPFHPSPVDRTQLHPNRRPVHPGTTEKNGSSKHHHTSRNPRATAVSPMAACSSGFNAAPDSSCGCDTGLGLELSAAGQDGVG